MFCGLYVNIAPAMSELSMWQHLKHARWISDMHMTFTTVQMLKIFNKMELYKYLVLPKIKGPMIQNEKYYVIIKVQKYSSASQKTLKTWEWWY